MRCASRVTAERVGLLALLLAVASCGQLRPLEGELRCTDYQATIQPLLNDHCVSCHGDVLAGGDFKLTSRLDAVARRDDGSLRVEGADGGFEGSAMLAAVTGELPGHPALSAEAQQTIEAWLVPCKANNRVNLWHVRGWATPGSDTFHGAKLRSTGYDVTTCQKCHGDDFSGGKAQVSCQDCHGKDVFACKTCHGSASNQAPPKGLDGSRLTTDHGVGAHQSHVRDTALHLAFACDKCHVNPKDDIWQPGHFRLEDGGAEDGRAEVHVFSADGGPASYDFDQLRCSNTACHAPLADSQATNQTPTWNKVNANEAACGTCHGNPPATHSSEKDCGLCHVGAFVDGGVVPATHVDGTIEVGRPGDAKLTCTSCHGDAQAFRDVRGNTDPRLVSVGAHQIHLDGRRRLTAPITCAQCHQVPSEVRSPGHIDHPLPATVFPMVAGVGALTYSDSAMPQWNEQAATCTNTYCHGGGARAGRDTSPSKLANIVWTGASTPQVYCGSCHGMPPNTAAHADAGTSLFGCYLCHGATLAANGTLKVTYDADGGTVTTHLNGVVELGQ